jgi:predicted O-linked N-acetylglucosamine transferase (SPINDLY family)
MDYIIGDPTVISEDRQRFFSERVAWLPHCFLPNDNARRIGTTPSRRDAGLPERGFVFCNFGKAHKITPDMFDSWMRLIVRTEGSVLWLAQASAAAERNLKREAEQRGVKADRILFAPFVKSPEEHLARISLADLFLDTFPYNAHATACDFLWASVPVLTLTGGGYAGRVGASALAAAGVDALITHTLAEYETVALHLARTPSELQGLKQTLANKRGNCPLFDTARYTRNLESAYITMWRRHQDGVSPASFSVTDRSAP